MLGDGTDAMRCQGAWTHQSRDTQPPRPALGQGLEKVGLFGSPVSLASKFTASRLYALANIFVGHTFGGAAPLGAAGYPNHLAPILRWEEERNPLQSPPSHGGPRDEVCPSGPWDCGTLLPAGTGGCHRLPRSISWAGWSQRHLPVCPGAASRQLCSRRDQSTSSPIDHRHM